MDDFGEGSGGMGGGGMDLDDFGLTEEDVHSALQQPRENSVGECGRREYGRGLQ